MQDKQVYLSQSMSDRGSPQPRQNTRWEAVYSDSTLRSALRRLFPRTMSQKQSPEYSINADHAKEGRVNEMEETASTDTRSSFADLWDSTSVEIRDGSYQRGEFNPTTSLLQTCKSQVVFPYFCILSMVAWRPFHRQSFRHQRFWKVLNILYTCLVFALIIFSYASSIVACQARLLDIKNEPTSTTVTASTIHPTTINITTTPAGNGTTTTRSPNSTATTTTSINLKMKPQSNTTTTASINTTVITPMSTNNSVHHTNSTGPITGYTLGTAKPAYWKPAVMECQHIFSTYVVPSLLHFLAFLMGFYQFRIQESEGLHALIEKVFLVSTIPKKIVARLRLFLFLGIFWVFLSAGNFVLFCHAFTLESVTGFHRNLRVQYMYVVASFMGLGKVLESLISMVIVVNYCAQCELLIFYLREITLRMEEKTGDLNIIMKDVLEVKKNLSRVNGIISVIATLIVFTNCELAVISLCNLVVTIDGPPDFLEARPLYRLFVSIIGFVIIIFPVGIAARLSAAARVFKQKSLQIRVFGFPSASQLDLDSFVLFSHSAVIKAKLLCMPVKGYFVMGVGALMVFVLLLMLQTGIIAGSNQYL